MLALDSIIETAVQAGEYGEDRNAALDHLRVQVAGPRQHTRKRVVSVADPEPGQMVRKWDESQGFYVYVKK